MHIPAPHTHRSRFTASLTEQGPVAADEVWDRYVVPSRWTSWAPHLTAVNASEPTIHPGTTGSVTAAGVVRASFVVDEVDAARRRWSWTVRLGPIVLHLVHRVLDPGSLADAGPGRSQVQPGCTTQVEITGPRLVVLPYLPVMSFALRRLVSADLSASGPSR
ncbi:SRPBCC family protein [Gephyromycinifex aptenodytis]|uniref:SRPBCC family protein n=1 Tax=Gephyromycinifex aptenodytis TaxID=2716227 RepID=UPI001445787E|nr:SRPBCC family protein [Gephyromycinifex aptenodytis]